LLAILGLQHSYNGSARLSGNRVEAKVVGGWVVRALNLTRAMGA
jgi:hypothetical protein